MKRLFALKEAASGGILDEFFPNKMLAKGRRDELNKEAGCTKYVVTKGPDHDKVKRK